MYFCCIYILAGEILLSHGVRNWGKLSFYSFPSALSDGYLMAMSMLRHNKLIWIGWMSRGYISVEEVARWRFGGILDKPGLRRGVVSNHSMVHVMWKSFLGWANIHLEHMPTLLFMYATVLMCGFDFFFSWMIYMTSKSSYVCIYIYMISFFPYICVLYVLQGDVTHTYTYIYINHMMFSHAFPQ